MDLERRLQQQGPDNRIFDLEQLLLVYAEDIRAYLYRRRHGLPSPTLGQWLVMEAKLIFDGFLKLMGIITIIYVAVWLVRLF